jgi:hypothetical protein
MSNSQSLNNPKINNLKITSPTLHFYHYVLRNSLNETAEKLEERRDLFSKSLHKVACHFTSQSGKNAGDFVRLIPLESDLSSKGSLLDLTQVPDECKKPNSDRLYLQTGIHSSRLAVRRLNDTYLLRFTRYVSSTEGPQSLKIFDNLSEHISTLPLELGQTAILAGIIPETEYQPAEIPQIAAECLKQYLRPYSGAEIKPEQVIQNEFLGSPFCIYWQSLEWNNEAGFSLKSIRLAAVFLYKYAATENKANIFYNILQDMLLSYHKIHFFHSQSLALKQILSQQYEEIERLAENYAQEKWDKESLKTLPQQSLDYYKRLSQISDQKKTLEANLHNYRECLKQIEQYTQQPMPAFFQDFPSEADYYLQQIKTTIGFLSPGLQLYEQLMLTVQTQVSIDDEKLQTQQSLQQQKLGQLLTGSCAAIAIGQILSPAITASVSHYYIDKNQPQSPSVGSLWVGGFLTIVLSLLSGWVVSRLVYRWFTNEKL